VPIETATFISQLNAANPLATDPIAQADDHIRLTKAVLQSQFVNLGTVAVTATSAQINTAGSLVATAGTLEVDNGTASAVLQLDAVTGSGALLVKNTGTNGAAGSLAVVMNDATNANPLLAMTLTRAGALNATTSLNAPVVTQAGLPIIPTGVIVLWSGTIATIPTGWVLCDGTNGTPNLRDRFILGAGGASLPGAVGGAASSTATTSTTGAHTHTGLTGTQGAFSVTSSTDGAHTHTGATASYTLTTADIPSHSHGIALFTDVTNTSNLGQVTSKSGNAAVSGTTTAIGGGGGHSHSISSDGSHNHVVQGPDHQHTIGSDGNHAHTVTVPTVPVFFALAYIMKS
jgi:hypothetical protein